MSDPTSHPTMTSQSPNAESEQKDTSPAHRAFRIANYDLKLDPQGVIHLGYDGVMRSFDGTYDRNVVDAVSLNPAQIKNFLDKFPQPWSQETEDKFRGVDGTTVVDHEALFNPPDELRPPKYTEEDKIRLQKEIDEENQKINERIEREEAEGVDIAAKYACGRIVNDYDLRPQKRMSG